MGSTSEDLIERAWLAFDDGEYEEAEALARRALMIDPGSVEARLAAARALVNMEEHASAIPLLREASALEPGDAEARAFLGVALFERCVFAEALEHLRAAVDLDPDLPDSHYWLALALERTGDYAAAERAFQSASKLDPENYPLPHRISRDACLDAVEEARRRLPAEYDPFLQNVAIRVEDLPDEAILTDGDPPLDPCLLGLFVGVPITEKVSSDLTLRLPDMVFIFQRNLERTCQDRETLVEELYKTLYHEIGHYMGRDEDELAELGMA